MIVSFISLGCDKNRVNTEQMMALCLQSGMTVQEDCAGSDVVVVNTCGFIDSAKLEAIETILSVAELKAAGRVGKILVTGCLSQRYQAELLEELPEVDGIMGTGSYGDIVSAVEQVAAGQKFSRFADISGPVEELPRVISTPMHYAYLRIAEGCSNRCAYCIIPYARGPVRSKPIADMMAELTQLAAQGYQEVVLVGINLPCYGKDLGLRLIDAVEAACQVDGIRRVRLGSLEPELLTAEDLNRLSAQPKFCPQFHLSLQSGCDRTLKAMNRHYDSAEYRRIVEDIRKAFENPSITTDIMVGFPGETEEDFQQSADFAKEIGLAKAHIFAYSVRPGTRAASMPDQVPQREKETRSARLIEVTDKTRQAFLQSQVGREEDVLFETTQTPYGIEGYTPNYTPVCVETKEDIRGTIRRVRITAALTDLCLAELI